MNITDDLAGLVIIPSAMGNKKLYIGTLLAGLCSSVLGELSVLVCLNYFIVKKFVQTCSGTGSDSGKSYWK